MRGLALVHPLELFSLQCGSFSFQFIVLYLVGFQVPANWFGFFGFVTLLDGVFVGRVSANVCNWFKYTKTNGLKPFTLYERDDALNTLLLLWPKKRFRRIFCKWISPQCGPTLPSFLQRKRAPKLLNYFLHRCELLINFNLCRSNMILSKCRQCTLENENWFMPNDRKNANFAFEN